MTFRRHTRSRSSTTSSRRPLLPTARRHFAASVDRTGGRIGTGFIGTPALLPALTNAGLHDLAAKVFLQEEAPGWRFQVRMGATTIWECWDPLREDGSINRENMNSYNHYAYGAVCEWLFGHVAGVRPSAEAPGFRRILISPQIVPELSPVSARHRCRLGWIEARWSVAGRRVAYDFTIPAGAEGVLDLPARYRNAVLDGAALSPDAAAPSVGPGTHSLTFNLPDEGAAEAAA